MLLPTGMKGLTNCKTSPIKMYTVEMTKRKLNFRTHNDLQASHVISIFAVFKKLSQKGSYKMMHFLFKALKTVNFRISFLKNSGGGGQTSAALSLQTLVQTVMQIFYVLLFIF